MIINRERVRRWETLGKQQVFRMAPQFPTEFGWLPRLPRLAGSLTLAPRGGRLETVDCGQATSERMSIPARQTDGCRCAMDSLIWGRRFDKFKCSTLSQYCRHGNILHSALSLSFSQREQLVSIFWILNERIIQFLPPPPPPPSPAPFPSSSLFLDLKRKEIRFPCFHNFYFFLFFRDQEFKC